MELLKIMNAYINAYYTVMCLAFIGLITVLYLLCRIIWFFVSHTSKKTAAPVDHMQTKRIRELESDVALLKRLESELADIRDQVNRNNTNI